VYLVNDQLLHAFDRVLVLEAEVELGGASWFIGRIMPDLKVGMVQGLLTSNSLRRIEVEHPGQEIDRERVGMGYKGGERNSRFDWERTDVLLGTRGTNTAKSILRWSSEVVQDLVELINVVPALENWFSEKQLGEDTSNGPNVNGGRVVGETQHDLGGSVPPGGNVFGHETLIRTTLGAGTSTRSIPSRKAKVADFELTVRINQEVTRLEVTMNNVSGVNVLETAKGLINKRLEMSV